MAGKDSRREPRIDLDLSVTLLLPEGEREYPVGDASYRGVFLVSENPLPLRKLVRFRTRLSDDEEPLQMMGLVAHHISTAEANEIGRDPGMGIHLFSVGRETHRRWRRFIREHYEENPEAREEFKRLEYPHVVAHLPSNSALAEFFDDDLGGGEMFVRSSEVHSEGSPIICDIVHPNGTESIDLEGRVLSAIKSPPRKRGMKIEFADLDAEDQRRVQAFIDGDFDEIDRRTPGERDEELEDVVDSEEAIEDAGDEVEAPEPVEADGGESAATEESDAAADGGEAAEQEETSDDQEPTEESTA